MKKTILTSVAALIACTAPAFAADVNGSIEAGVRINEVMGNKGKANEYRDSSSGSAIVNFGLGLSLKNYYLELDGKSGFSLTPNAEDMERKDQSYLLKGGQYESFKYSLFYNQIPHNITTNAVSLYRGTGSGVLTAPFLASVGAPAAGNNAATVATAITNVRNLKTAETNAPKFSVDYGVTRRNYGAGLEVSLNTPFFISARAERNETNGILPLGTYLGQEKEIPMPVNYLTENLYLETGYRTKNLVATVDGTLSSFHEKIPSLVLGFTNTSNPGNTIQSQNMSLPPSNEYYKVGGSVKYVMPFIKSTLMARGSYSKTSNEQTLFDRLTSGPISGTNPVPGALTVPVNNGARFNGDINYTTASVSLVSNPTTNLDTRIFMNYLNKKNESTQGFDFTNAPFGSALTVNNVEGFGYHKINGGFDVGYKLPAKTKLAVGYEYLNLVRGIRTDATKTTDHIAYVQVKNDLFDWMGAKVRAQHMLREGKFETEVAAAAGEGYFRPFDAATKTQDQIKVGFEFEPLHNVSLGIEYAYKIDQYRDSVMGVQNAKSHDIYFDSSITAGPIRINPYVDVELSDQASAHRVGNNNMNAAGVATQATAAGAIVSGTPAYNWINDAKNVYYALGVNTEMTLIKDRLFANIGGRYESSDGTERFRTDLTTADIYNPIVNNNYLDTYIRKSITGKLTAKFTKQLKATASYTFENLKYTDDHYSGYNNIVSGEAGGGYLLTGAYNNPNYNAHIGYMSLAYSF